VLLMNLSVPAWANKPDISGWWDWHNRLQTKNGDIRSEDEAWLLVQEGTSIRGRYRRKVTFLSAKGKPYACNGLVRYQRIAVYQIKGIVEGTHITLKEVSVQVQPSPCDDGQRRLDSYRGVIESGNLHIHWTGGQEVLRRRNLTGLWMGRNRKTLHGGDQASWQEMWHIRQAGNKVVGLRDRTDVRTSGDGQSYRCSHSLKIVRALRWRFEGYLRGAMLVLSLAAPLKRHSPCEQRNVRPTNLTITLDYDPDQLKISGPEASLVLTRQDRIQPAGFPDDIAADRRPKAALLPPRR